MKQYKFKGDPNGYQWDFPLVPGRTYPGNKEADRRHSIEETMEMARSQKDENFLKEWEEVTPL